MTTLSLMKIKLDNYNYNYNYESKKEIDFAFKLVSIANKNRIGIKIAGNIWHGFRLRLDNTIGKNELLAELLDNPIVNYTEELFLGKGGKNYNQRMNRILNFLEGILNFKNVLKITLDIDAYDTEAEAIREKLPVYNLKVNDFVNFMSELYDKNGQCIPTVRLVFTKQIEK